VNSIVACCHSAKLCAYAAWDFRSQQYLTHQLLSNSHTTVLFFIKKKTAINMDKVYSAEDGVKIM